jgi:hypothetical protein
MQTAATDLTFLIVACVLFFFLLCIAFVVIVDHKARLPGEFTNDPFSIVGMRRDHPVFGFVITMTLLVVIASLLAALTAALAERLGLTGVQEPQGLLAKLKNERTAERVRHFHNLAPRAYAIEGKKNVCFLCHGDYPHSRAPMIRTLLNMHTQFVACMTCHQNPEKIPETAITLRWMNFSGIAVKGPPFGTDVDAATGALVQTDDYYSKITAYARQPDGTESLLEFTADDPRTQEFASVRERLTDADRDAVKKKFHANVNSKGRFCTRCHTGGGAGFVPFRQLGFSERRARDLTDVNIVGLVSKYREFYLPLLTRGDALPPAAKMPAGNKGGPDMRQDTRAWWKRSYDAPRPAPAKPQ